MLQPRYSTRVGVELAAYMDDDVVMNQTHTNRHETRVTGRALPYTNDTRVTYEKGDRVMRNEGEYATVLYRSQTHDYAELMYSTGYSFRTAASEWQRVEGDELNAMDVNTADAAHGEMECSYCGEDIVTGEKYHNHQQRAKRIHSVCFEEHMTNGKVTGRLNSADETRIRETVWGRLRTAR